MTKTLSTRKNYSEKQLKINYSKTDFFNKYKENIIGDSVFKNKLPKFLNYFDIDKDDLKRDNYQFEIQHDISDLLSLLAKSYMESPLCDGRYTDPNFNSSKVVDYNTRTIDDVNKLPDYIKYFIKNTENFKFNYSLSKFVPLLLDRLTLLFSTISTCSDSNAGNILIDLISSIDGWIDSYLIHTSELDYYKAKTDSVICNVNSFNQINGQKDLGYSIDNVLRESFKTFYRPNNLEFDDDIPDHLLADLLECEETTPESKLTNLREEYTDFLNSKYTTPEHLKRQDDEYKAINEYADSKAILSPETFRKSKTDYIRFYINSLNEALLKCNAGHSINQSIDGINASIFIEILISCTHDKLEKTIVSCARDIYELKLKAIEMKYELYKQMKNSNQNINLNLIRQHFDSALGQTLLLILNKEYNCTNPTKER